MTDNKSNLYNFIVSYFVRSVCLLQSLLQSLFEGCRNSFTYLRKFLDQP